MHVGRAEGCCQVLNNLREPGWASGGLQTYPPIIEAAVCISVQLRAG